MSNDQAHRTPVMYLPLLGIKLSMRLHTQLVVWALLLLAAVLPFESSGGLPLFGLLFNSVELAATLVTILWLGLLVYERRRMDVSGWLAIPMVLFMVSLVVSALLAPEYGRDALKFTLRQAQGALIGLCVAERLRAEGWPLARNLLLALAAGAGVSASLGLWELGETTNVLGLLAPFKTQLSFMGGLLRLSGTFVYANVAAMFYEAILPIALVGAIGLLRGWWRLLGFGLAGLLLAATLFTYSRAALIVCAALLVLLPCGIWLSEPRHTQRRRSVLVQAVGGSVVVGLVLVALLSLPTFRLRLLEPNIDDWYGATYQATPIQQMGTNELRSVDVQIRNSGRVAWPEGGVRPVMLAYHWFDPLSGRAVVFDGLRTPLPHSIAPGEAITLYAQIQAPTVPGSYELAWDLLREHGGGWFSQYQVAPARERVTIIAGSAAQPATPQAAPHRTTLAPVTVDELPQPSRGQLWRAALAIWGTRPVVGIGPGVFQYIYGPYIGMQRWDTRIHTNNVYLELLVGAGLLGLMTFLSLIGAQVVQATIALRESRSGGLMQPQLRWALLACMLALTAFLIHGMLDAFLGFMTTNLLLWMLLGRVSGLCALMIGRKRANTRFARTGWDNGAEAGEHKVRPYGMG
ncbi:MAG: O-antigen ligase family protein [Roseiflexaceae bacterium]|nr:O-antigen ligase family protein [Roseiflexaceae bacterium]